jgi:hypothetical protein
MWPAGSLEDLVSNLIKNWKKETSHKSRLEDWRTVNTHKYTFSCNGGQEHSAEEMQELGTSNALIQATPSLTSSSSCLGLWFAWLGHVLPPPPPIYLCIPRDCGGIIKVTTF